MSSSNSPPPASCFAPRIAAAFIVALVLAQALKESLTQAIALLACVFVCLYAWQTRWQSHPEFTAAQRFLKPIGLGFAAYFLLHLLRLRRAVDLHTLDGPLRFLLFIPLLYLPMIARWDWRRVAAYLPWSGVLFGLTALMGVLHPTVDHRSFGFFTYYNLYGYASTMLLGLLIMSSCAQKNGGLLVLGSLGCLGASAVSGTRGAWVALPLLLILIAWQAMTSAKPLKNTALMALVLAGVTAASWPLLQERIHKGQQDLSLNQPQQQQPSNATTTTSSSEDLNTSMGYRIAMWTIATKMIEDKPWLGQGSSVFPEQMQPWADKLGLNARFPDGGFQNPHNQFLGWAAVHGIPIALLLLSGVWIVPCVQVKKARRGCSDKTNVLRLEWRSLLLLVGMTALFGLTESVLERQRGAAWFMVWVCLLAGSAIYRATSAPSTGGGTS